MPGTERWMCLNVNVRRNFITWCVVALICVLVDGETNSENQLRAPTVVIAFLVRNKAHTLPYFLTLLERLNYPKDRISLWIRSDHNEDQSLEILKKWLPSVENKYHSVNAELLSSPPTHLPGENSSTEWPRSRYTHIIQLREDALMTARYMWADYLWLLDSDVFITNENTLQSLINEGYTVTAPMLRSDGMYSNFWCGMTEDYYYKRTDDYQPILYRERTGCFSVPMINSAVLINLRHTSSTDLTYVSSNVPQYDGPYDDTIIFALGANKTGVPLYICNNEIYGYIMVPLVHGVSQDRDYEQLINLKVEVLVENPPLPVNDVLSEYVTYPEPNKMEFDEIFMINLLRRPERRERMLNSFKELGIKSIIVNAVDGRLLNESVLKEWDIHLMPSYEDPYHKRPITMGEVGCFLSHYNIWRTVVERGYGRVMVLEDDIRFEPYFRHKLAEILREVDTLQLDWDLIYLGRKRMQEAEEPWVPGSRLLVVAGYSYWTLGYLLSQQGARKLVAAKPLDNLLPVDEYIPLMFDKHPHDPWKQYYPQRDLIAFSAYPLLVYPTHYTGEEGYISDTEDSATIKLEKSHTDIKNEEL